MVGSAHPTTNTLALNAIAIASALPIHVTVKRILLEEAAAIAFADWVRAIAYSFTTSTKSSIITSNVRANF